MGAILITHTRSRVATERLLYARTAIRLLEAAGPDGPSKYYNIAKAYHFIGQYSKAEQSYLMVLATAGPGPIRTLALFNLAIIYRKTRSKAMYRDLLTRYG